MQTDLAGAWKDTQPVDLCEVTPGWREGAKFTVAAGAPELAELLREYGADVLRVVRGPARVHVLMQCADFGAFYHWVNAQLIEKNARGVSKN